LIGTALLSTPPDSTAADQSPRSLDGGAMRERAVLVWRDSGQVASVVLRVWDPEPALEREFNWTPADPATLLDGDDEAGVTGSGRLVWRAKGAADYDGRAVDTVYEGELVGGRPQGQGMETGADGSRYSGEWRLGLPEGPGELRLANGDEYQGGFHAGMFDGQGRYAGTDGRVYAGEFARGAFLGAARSPTVDQAAASAAATMGPGTEHQGTEDAAGRMMRTAQAAVTGVDFKVYTDKQRYTSVIDGMDYYGYVTYDHRVVDGRVAIMPANRGIMAAWKANGPIDPSALDGNREFGAMPVFLVGDITNNSDSSLNVESAFLEVGASVADLKPFPLVTAQMNSPDVVGCAQEPVLDGRIIIDNYGWGPIENASTTIRFSRKKQAAGDGSRAAELDLKTFNDYQTVKVTPLLQQFGVNTNALSTNAKGCPSKSAVPGCIRKVAASGIFGEIADQLYAEDRYAVTDVVGILKYEWMDTAGQRHSQASPYRVTIPVLGFTVPESPECGAA